jgi:hypothetical protein
VRACVRALNVTSLHVWVDGKPVVADRTLVNPHAPASSNYART